MFGNLPYPIWWLFRRIKKIGKWIADAIIDILMLAGISVIVILHKVLTLCVFFTNIGFLIAIYYFYTNIRETLNGINFFETQNFNNMIMLVGLHIIVYFLWKVTLLKE